MLATINASSLNVRSLPSNSGRVLGVLPSGTVVDVLSDPKDIADSWAEIRYQDQTAFVYGAYLQPTHHSQRLSGIVDTPLLNVREAASVASDILGTVRQGVVVNIRGQAGSWFEIEFNGGAGLCIPNLHRAFLCRPGCLYCACVGHVIECACGR